MRSEYIYTVYNVCLCLCRQLYGGSRINEVQERASIVMYVFLDFNLGFVMFYCRVIPSFAYLELQLFQKSIYSKICS